MTTDGLIYELNQGSLEVKSYNANIFQPKYFDIKCIPDLCGLGDQLAKLQIKKIGGGQSHYLILTYNNEIYSCGSNNYGQLGINSFVPNPVSKLYKVKLPPIIDISCGPNANMVVTVFGDIFVWGYNVYGNLGTDIRDHILYPHKISFSL